MVMEMFCFEASLIFHLDIHKLLVEFIGLNCSLFELMSSIIYEDHIDKMGTRAEVFALGLYFSIPVSAVMERSNHEYYWAKYGMSQTPRENLIFTTDFHATIMIWIMYKNVM